MKNSIFQNTILSHGECLLEGNYDTIIPCYQEVLPVFIGGKAILIDGHDSLRGAFANLRERLLAEGVTRSVGTVISRAQTEQERFHFVVDWHYNIGFNIAPKTSLVAYFCVQQNGKTLVEMVEYKKVAFPNISGWKRFDVSPSRSKNHVDSGYLH